MKKNMAGNGMSLKMEIKSLESVRLRLSTKEVKIKKKNLVEEVA